MQVKIDNKTIVIKDSEIKKLMESLEITETEAVETWLFDHDYATNEQVEILTKKAKENKTDKLVVTDKTKRKPVERVAKENPTKELIIAEIAKALQNLGVADLKIENKAKIITFNYVNESFKVDLIQKRKPKA